MRAQGLVGHDAGAVHHAGILTEGELSGLRTLADGLGPSQAGLRLFKGELSPYLAPDSALTGLAQRHLGQSPVAVRAVVFDKSPATNWGVPWHQDRTIAVKSREALDGFEVWSRKDGIDHVEPPMSVLEHMVTVKLLLDDCAADAGPLLVVAGSHKLGRVAANDADSLVQQSPIIACTGSAGDAWVLATSILHASKPSTGTAHRRILHIDFAAEPLPAPLEWYGV